MANQLANQLAAQEGKILDTLLSGKVPLTITGYLGALAPAPAPILAPIPPESASEPAPTNQSTDPPIVTSLAKLFTVKDA